MTENRAGRHRPARGPRKLWPIILAAVVVCVAAAGTAWGLTRGGGPSDATHSAPATASTPAAQTSSPSPSATPSDSSSPSSGATPTSSITTRSAALDHLDACRATIETGQKMVTAADKNYADWSGHVYAQTDYDKGKITFKQAEAIWDRTKKAGPDDLKKYDAAKKAWDKADHKACTGLQPGDGATANVVKACTDRSAAMIKVIDKGGPVYAGWKGHQAQMTHTEEKSNDPDAYFKEWFGRVHNAEKPLAAYKKAQTAYRRTATCPAA